MRANKSRFVLSTCAASAALTFLAIPLASAQDDNTGLDEVIVQARKVTENLQDVPLSVSVISSEDIARQNLSSTEDISKLDPSVIFDYGASMQDMRVVIRGLSPTRGRVNSAILIDGVDVTSESIQFAGGSLLAGGRLFDLEQVEIVKGPQAALYGRSSFAGAISYRTKDPAKEFGGEVRLDGGDYGRYSFGAGFDIPVSDSFGIRLSGTYWSSDGIYRNTALNEKVGGGEGYGAALTAKWEATENFSARFRLDFNDDDEDVRAARYLRSNVRIDPAAINTCASAPMGSPDPRLANPNCVFAGTGLAGNTPGSFTRLFYWGSVGRLDDFPDKRTTYSPDPTTGQMFPGSERQIVRANLNLNWKLGQGTLTSITGYTDADSFFWQDLDHDSIWNPVTNRDDAARSSEFKSDTKTKQFTQELRYRSDFDGIFNFALGGEYYSADDDNITASISMSCFPAFFNCGVPMLTPVFSASQLHGQLNAIDRAWGRELDHTSIYGLVEFDITDRLTFEVEARYSDESETIYGPNCDPANTSTAFGFPLICADVTTTPMGSPFPPGTPGVVFPFTVDFPSSTQLFSPLTPGGVRQQTSVTAIAPEYKSEFTAWRTYLSYKATDDVNIYATVGRSIKPGGRSTVTAGNWLDGDYDGVFDDTLYGPEKLTAYELGFKMQWLQNRLRTNFAFFSQRYTDKQTGTQRLTPNGTPVGRIINAGKANIDGFEADVQWKATDHLTLAAAYSYLDAKYTDFKFRSNSPTDAIRSADCTKVTTIRTPAPPGSGGQPTFRDVISAPVTLAPGETATFSCQIDALKNRSLRLEDVPEHSLVLQARYERPIAAFGGSSWYIEGDSQIQTERFIDPSNRRFVEDYVLANLRIGLIDDDKRWEAMLYVNNLFDDDTILTAQDQPGDVDAGINTPNAFGPTDGIQVQLPDPQIIGLRFNWRFGGK